MSEQIDKNEPAAESSNCKTADSTDGSDSAALESAAFLSDSFIPDTPGHGGPLDEETVQTP